MMNSNGKVVVFLCLITGCCLAEQPDPVPKMRVKSGMYELNVTWSAAEGESLIYIVTLSGPDDKTEEVNVTELSHNFTGLTPCSPYNVSVIVENSDGEQSNASIKHVGTRPEVPPAPTGLSAVNISSTELYVSWDPVNMVGNNCKAFYHIYAMKDGSTYPSTNLCTQTNCTITMLDKFTSYDVRVKAYAYLKSSQEGPFSPTITITTSPDISEEVRVSVCKPENKEILCEWRSPYYPNGIISGYRLDYQYEFENILYNFTQIITDVNIMKSTFKPQKPTRFVNITIWPINQLGLGEPDNNLNVRYEWHVPPPNEDLSSVLKVNKDVKVKDTEKALTLPSELDEGSVVIRLVTLAVQMGYGSFSVEGTDRYDNKPVSSSYKMTTAGQFGPYEIILSRSKLITTTSGSDKTFSYILGEDASMINCSYCNGPLKKSEVYRVSLRAYSDDGWRTYGQILINSSAKDNNLAIILGCVFGVLILLLIVICVFIMYKRGVLCFANNRPERVDAYSSVQFKNNSTTVIKS